MIAFDTEVTTSDLWHGGCPFFFSFATDGDFGDFFRQMDLDWVDSFGNVTPNDPFDQSPVGNVFLVEWSVCPFTRRPAVNPVELDCMVDLLGSDYGLVGHNIKFDLRAMEVANGFVNERVPALRGFRQRTTVKGATLENCSNQRSNSDTEQRIPDRRDGFHSGNEQRDNYQIEWSWTGIHDTCVMSHCWRNLWGHSLKNLREILFFIGPQRQERLREATNHARRICRRKDFGEYIRDRISNRTFLLPTEDEQQFLPQFTKQQLLTLCDYNEEHYGSVFRIAGPGDPHWPAIIRSPKDKGEDSEGWWYFDTWLPRCVALLAEEFLPNVERRTTESKSCFGDENNNSTEREKTTRRQSSANNRIPRGGQQGTKRLEGHPWLTVLRNYGREDAESTLMLYGFLKEALKSEGLWDIYMRRRRMLEITYNMESKGFPLRPEVTRHVEKYRRLSTSYEEQAQQIVSKSRTQRDRSNVDSGDSGDGIINLASNDQLRALLYDEWKLPVIKRTPPSKKFSQGQASTDYETLKTLANETNRPDAEEFLRLLLLGRKALKTQTYLENFSLWSDDKGLLHGSVNITGTKWTRQSVSNPALQIIPNADDSSEAEVDFGARASFGPPPGYEFFDFDYSNLELRIWANLCGNRELIESFENGISVHLIIARELHPSLRDMSDEEAKETKLYKKTKNGNFAIIYGASPRKANETYGLRNAYQRIAKRFPEVEDFTKTLHLQVADRGYVYTQGGYRLYVPSDAPHKAVSATVQGTAGDVIGRAMDLCDRELQDSPGDMLLQVHDQLVFTFPTGDREWVPRIKDTMELASEQILGYRVPVSSRICPVSWDVAA